MTLKERIKQSRVTKGYSQNRLAELVGVSRSACCQWENGLSLPSVKNLATLARKLGVRFEWLATGRGRRFYDAHYDEHMETGESLPVYSAGKEHLLFEYYDKLNAEQKAALLEFMRTLTNRDGTNSGGPETMDNSRSKRTIRPTFDSCLNIQQSECTRANR